MQPSIPGIQAVARTAAREFRLTSVWRLAAPVDAVWDALNDPESWPLWWPYVRSVRTLRPGRADGVGSVRRMAWATRLPYGFVIEVEAVEVQRHECLRALARGHVCGEGLWSLRAAGPASTDVTYVWRVEVTKPWMRWLAPVFRWNHREVMRAGGLGLARYLARKTSPASPASAGTGGDLHTVR